MGAEPLSLAAGADALARAVHDLRGPLTVIRGLCATLARDERPDQRRRGLAMIDDEALRLAGALDRLLGGVAPALRRPARLALASLVEGVVERHRAVAEGAGVALSLRLSGAPSPVLGDAELIGRALANLIENAIRHCESPGEVRVALTVRGRWAHLRVHDDGPGVAPEDRERIFLAGERGGAPRRPGHGLGLAITREVAEVHRGRLVLEPLGSGACFRLSLPLAPPRLEREVA